MIKKKILRMALLFACFIIVSFVTMMTGLGWNVKSARLVDGVFVTPAFGEGSFMLPVSDSLYQYIAAEEEAGMLIPLTSVDTINNGDTVYVQMLLNNGSNIAMYCRFKIDAKASNVEANYRFFFDLDSLTDLSCGNNDENDFKSDGEWHYYANVLEPNREYTVWLEINIIKKESSNVIVGTPYADMMQARGVVDPAEIGWAEIAGQNPGFFK